MKKIFIFALALIIPLSALFGCGRVLEPSLSQGGAENVSCVSAAFVNAPISLNPYTAINDESRMLFSLCTAALYRSVPENGGTACLPELADGDPVPLNEEGTKWSISLKPGLFWANGESITSSDVIFSIKAFYDPKTRNYEAVFEPLFGLEITGARDYLNDICEWGDVGVFKTDRLSFEIETVSPASAQMVKEYFALRPLVYEPLYTAGLSTDKRATDYGSSPEKFMSAGRYVLSDWTAGSMIRFTRNDDSPFKDALAQKLVFYIASDEDSALKLFLKGEADGLPFADGAKKKLEGDTRFREYFDGSVWCFVLNAGNPAQDGLFNDPSFKEAIYRAIDRKALAAAAGGVPTTRLFGRNVLSDPESGNLIINRAGGFSESVSDAFDPSLAKEALYKTFESRKISSASITFLYRDDDPRDKLLSEALSASFRSVFDGALTFTTLGIEGEQADLLRRWDPEAPDSFEAGIIKLNSDNLSPLKIFYEISPKEQMSPIFYSNEEFDELLKDANTKETSESGRIADLCLKMEKLLLEDKTVIPCFEIPKYSLFSDSLSLPRANSIPFFGFPEYVTK